MYSKEQIAEFKKKIITQLAEGKSLKRTLEEDNSLPSRERVYEWLNENHHKYDKVFRDNYAGAREESADRNAEFIEDIAHDVLKGNYTPDRAKVAIDALKWTAGVKKPKKYGKRIDHTSDGQKMESQVLIHLPHNDRETIENQQ